MNENNDNINIPVIDHRLLAGKLSVYNWLKKIPTNSCISEIVEVRFKNTRKAFFCNPLGLHLEEGDIVAVEAALGHDIGIVSLAGELVKEQLRMKKIDLEKNPLKKVYRKAKPHDIEKWQQAIALEYETMIRSRKIAADLKLNMKIGDVEYQGDKTKAIFYYIAEDRVDFRALIKVLAETFHIRIEMKQIGARQEAGRIGGIGPCGLQLCCSTYITNFISVSTSAARYQDISLNPQKLAGQCGKLKCCLNYEVDAYIDEQKDFPATNLTLNTGEGLLYHQKTDIFGRTMYYAFDKEGKGTLIKLSVKRIKEIIAMNRKGIIPPKANDVEEETEEIKYTDGVGEESLSRFDEKKQKKRRSKNRNNNNRSQNNNPRNNKSPRRQESENTPKE
ncbi:PSP1 domain-containing protein [Odoribacter lunatus]|uniref:PSP1 domain-containing protein n=1 Tax=Odoribacter lunatus TaxID=2941335 RepID=UPI00203AE972|nr:regulatory iron-sulfur-containing complex subunit RicT [Odoribacter lunatus]